MKAEIAKLWVAALRSGKYMQGTGRLRNVHNEFCCLGVLCNLHARAHPKIALRQKYSHLYMGERETLPVHVRDWAGMSTSEGFYDDVRPTVSLTADNDNGQTFMQIAKIIQKNVEVL